jgi:hypothetical protein
VVKAGVRRKVLTALFSASDSRELKKYLILMVYIFLRRK